jgi:hypothetical protein
MGEYLQKGVKMVCWYIEMVQDGCNCIPTGGGTYNRQDS